MSASYSFTDAARFPDQTVVYANPAGSAGRTRMTVVYSAPAAAHISAATKAT